MRISVRILSRLCNPKRPAKNIHSKWSDRKQGWEECESYLLLPGNGVGNGHLSWFFVGWRWWLTFLLQIGDLINFCNFWSILSWQYGQVWQNWVYKAKELARIWKVKLDQNFLTIPNLGSDACQLVYYFGLNIRYHTIVRTQKHHIRVLSLALHPTTVDAMVMSDNASKCAARYAP